MEILPLPAFRDNYIWLIRAGEVAAVVDPGDAEPVLRYLDAHHLGLSAILVTHHHADHTGGVAELKARYGATVFGPAAEHILEIDQGVTEGSSVRMHGIDLDLDVLDVPGHTRGHVAYYGPCALFCGDTLFGCGCGRLFEGTAAQMWQSLAKLGALPDDTQVYCAHEYTQSNIVFARAVEPGNAALLAREHAVAQLRGGGLPTVPSTLAEERETNPFLRAAVPAVARAVSVHLGQQVDDPKEVFAALRTWKDKF
jgi:hydroxyacylglutathione hydrolase